MTITGIEIRDFRGIANARLEGLTALTVLTGKNGCGKSAVLDALLLVASPDPLDALGRVVARHPKSLNGARWVIRNGAEEASAAILEAKEACIISVDPSPDAPLSPEPNTQLILWCQHTKDPTGNWSSPSSRKVRRGHVLFAADNTFRKVRGQGADAARPSKPGGMVLFDVANEGVPYPGAARLAGINFARLIDPGEAKPLHDSYSEAVRAGAKASILRPLKELLGDTAELEILTDHGESALYLQLEDKAVPVSLAGDGVHSLIHTLVELGLCRNGLALLEEPEAFQHPSALRATAAAIVATVKRGLQVVLTTHSQELIDRLLEEARQQGLPSDQASVATLELRDGNLLSAVRAGDALMEARQDFGEDLR